MQGTLWHHCLKHLEGEVPEQQFNTWVRPLQAIERDGELQLLAPNRFVVSWIEKNLFGRIEQLVSHARNGGTCRSRQAAGSAAISLWLVRGGHCGTRGQCADCRLWRVADQGAAQG